MLRAAAIIVALSGAVTFAGDARVGEGIGTGLSSGLFAAAAPLPWQEALATAERLWVLLQTWILDGYGRHPALMIGLAGVLTVPAIAIIGLALGRTRSMPVSYRPTDPGEIAEALERDRDGWLTIDGQPGARRPITSDILRIGRAEENDVRIAHKTVHRFHALIHRSTEGCYVIKDVSGPGGNGVRINGTPCEEAELKAGDQISLGAVTLRFVRETRTDMAEVMAAEERFVA